MDQPDPKSCEVAINVKHPYSHEKLESSGKEKGLSNSCQKFSDEIIVLEKQGHLSEQGNNSCEDDSLAAMDNCQNCDYVSARDCTDGVTANNLNPQSSSVSTSRRNLVAEVGTCEKQICAEGASGATSSSNGHASSTVQSNLACDRNSKDGEVSTEGIDFTQHISLKSDVSSETGPTFNKDTCEFDVGKARMNWLNAGEDGLKSAMQATFHDTQHKTESSSSNSTHVIHPVSSSNCSYQEISVEAKPSMHNCSSVNTSICTDFKSSVEERAAESEVLGMAAQITRKAVDNLRARDRKKVLGMITDQSSMIVEKVDIPNSSLSKQKIAEFLSQPKEELSYELDDAQAVAWKVAGEVEQKVGFLREAAASTSSVEGRNGETARLSSVDSADANKNSCLIETLQGIKLCNKQDSLDGSHSYKKAVDPEVPMKIKHFSAVKGKSQIMDHALMHEVNNGCHGPESSQFTTKREDVAAIDQTPLHSRFDLNENIHEDEVEYHRHSVGETISSDNVINVSMPIPVMAKSGIPVCLPVTPLKFEGELGWKGSAATSAFRPAAFFKSSNRNTASSISPCFSGIDLNVAASEDDSAMDLPRECVGIGIASGFPFKESSAEVIPKRAGKLNIDLNCLGEDDNVCPQSSVLSRHSMVDFDLNDNPSFGDTCNDAHQPGQGSQPLRQNTLGDAAVSFAGNYRQADFNHMRPACWGDLSSIQGFNHVHARPFMVTAPDVLHPMEHMQRVVPLQPKLSYAPQTLLSHSYPYNNAFFIGPADPLSTTIHSPGVLQYMADPHGTTVIPQILGHGTVPTFAGASHLMDAHGRIPSDIKTIRPSFDVNSGENSSENGNRGLNTRQYLFPARHSLMEEQMKSFQQVSLSATPMKRREPEGGWESYQLGYRQVTPWQ